MPHLPLAFPPTNVCLVCVPIHPHLNWLGGRRRLDGSVYPGLNSSGRCPNPHLAPGGGDVMYVSCSHPSAATSNQLTNKHGRQTVLYSIYIILFAVMTPALGKVADISSGSGGTDETHKALFYLGGVQFTLIAGLLLGSSFIPKGAWRPNPTMDTMEAVRVPNEETTEPARVPDEEMVVVKNRRLDARPTVAESEVRAEM